MEVSFEITNYVVPVPPRGYDSRSSASAPRNHASLARANDRCRLTDRPAATTRNNVYSKRYSWRY